MGDKARPDWAGRIRRAWDRARELDLAAVVISAPPNLQYLTGFDGSAGLLVLSAGRAALLLDGRYASAVRRRIDGDATASFDVVEVSGPASRGLAEHVTELDAGAIGIESERVTVAVLESWRRALPDRVFVSTSGLIEALRLIKDEGELAILREAGARLSDVARQLGRWVAEGRSEREIAADIDAAIMRAGFERPAFQTIVASGPNSAFPHARPTDRQLRQGDLVVLDFGGVLDGYCGDLTRMASVGQARADARMLVDAVRAAQEAAIRAVRPGVLASDIDRAAREVLAGRGFGDAFLHATGHGLGLELHEAPRLGRADHDRTVSLEAGMVFTIEPGAYIEGLGGARMEDDIAVTADGCEWLTSAPRDLLVVTSTL